MYCLKRDLGKECEEQCNKCHKESERLVKRLMEDHKNMKKSMEKDCEELKRIGLEFLSKLK